MKPSEVWLRYPSVHCTFPTFPGVDDVSSRGHTGMWLGILTSDMRMQPFYRYTPLVRISTKVRIMAGSERKRMELTQKATAVLVLPMIGKAVGSNMIPKARKMTAGNIANSAVADAPGVAAYSATTDAPNINAPV